MKFTLSWLKDHLDTDASLDEIVERLTSIGLEVESVDDKARLKPFVIAKVLTAEKHPDADKLRVLSVDTGTGAPVQVVCGAPNARAGLVGAFAAPGVHIPGTGITLGVGTIRGVESRGMMCSEKELNISDSHDGIIDLPAGITSSQLTEAANFLNAHMIGHTLPELRGQLQKLRIAVSNELDALSQDLVERGLAVWSGGSDEDMPARLIVRGRANLLEGLAGAEDVDRLRLLFDDLEKKDSLIELLNLAETGSGVRIFIGSENKLFSLSGSSLIVAPYRDEDDRIVGAVGVIGPTRLNYARIVPMVDYTAQIMGRLSRQRP